MANESSWLLVAETPEKITSLQIMDSRMPLSFRFLVKTILIYVYNDDSWINDEAITCISSLTYVASNTHTHLQRGFIWMCKASITCLCSIFFWFPYKTPTNTFHETIMKPNFVYGLRCLASYLRPHEDKTWIDNISSLSCLL